MYLEEFKHCIKLDFRLLLLYFYGDENPIQYINQNNPKYKVFSRDMMIDSIIQYELMAGPE